MSTKRGTNNEKMDVNVDVIERQTGIFQLSAGWFGTFFLQANVSQFNFLGQGQDLRVQALISGFVNQFNFQFEEPYFLGTRWTFGVNAYSTETLFQNFIVAASGGQLSWGRWLNGDVRFSQPTRLKKLGPKTPTRAACFRLWARGG